MERTLKRSNLHFERALARLPLGVAADSGYWGDQHTRYVKRAVGARLQDIDDNEYIDYRLGGGRVILGYADRRVARAARSGIELGGALSLATELELAVAERIARMVPCAQLVRFASSSADAIADALRVARAHSGRDEIAIVDGSHAWLLGDAPRAGGRATGSEARPSRAVTAGRGAFDAWFHSIPRNDANAFEELLCSRRDRIGALLIEPIPLSPAQPALDADTLASLRSLCDRFEIPLIVDESTTGFRVARGGAQQALGVRADLCTFGPSLANGYPIAALAGSEAIMRRFGKQVAQGIGSAAHPLSLAVADKTLQLL
ncbi:MAG TPA: aminotransferase class III-fold pyridoxal phosphate-dependent enzyme, partial [Myxococcota bacterium]|nr:aminotransferase class III-fold pyridoxal phosphate-dependent enzyme [Myxococcota bacterium]